MFSTTPISGAALRAHALKAALALGLFASFAPNSQAQIEFTGVLGDTPHPSTSAVMVQFSALAEPAYPLGIEKPSQDSQVQFDSQVKRVQALAQTVRKNPSLRSTLGAYVDANVSIIQDCQAMAGYSATKGASTAKFNSGAYALMSPAEAPTVCKHWAEQGLQNSQCTIKALHRSGQSQAENRQGNGYLNVNADLVSQVNAANAFPYALKAKANYECQLGKTEKSAEGQTLTRAVGSFKYNLFVDSTVEVAGPFQQSAASAGYKAWTSASFISPKVKEFSKLLGLDKPLMAPLQHALK